MKKLLILVLILGLTSAANAAISYTYSFTDTAGGAISSAPSDEDFVLVISRATITGNWGQQWNIYDSFENNGLNSDVADFSGSAFGGAQGSSPPASIPARDATYDGYWGITVGATGDPTDVYTGGSMIELTLTPSATGLFTMYNISSDYVTAIDSATINIVPEPLTIALLGLGGLFLRRRK